MAVAKADILEAVSGMTVLELNTIVKALEERFGVSAAAIRAPSALAASPADEMRPLP